MKPRTALWNYDTLQYDVFDMNERPADMRPYVQPNSRPLYDWLLNNGQDAWTAAHITDKIPTGDWENYLSVYNPDRLLANIWRAVLDRYQTHQEGGHAAGFATCSHPRCREAQLLASVLEGVLDRD